MEEKDKELEEYKKYKCYRCLGCNRLLIKDFKGTYRCPNFIPGTGEE